MNKIEPTIDLESLTPPHMRQVGGNHYKGMAIQPMDYSMKNGLDPLQHTAIKYISRFRDKGTPLEDLHKARHCIDMLIEWVEKHEMD